MDLHLARKRVLITGSTQGIGYAAARAFLGEGAAVIVNGRTEERVLQAVTALRAEYPGTTVEGVAADLGAPAGTQDVLEHLKHLGQAGEVDVLINNAGTFDVANFEDIDDEEWQRYFDVNVMSAVRLSRALLGPMLARNWGRIIFIGTESAVDVPGNMIHYGATKAAALALSNGLAKLTRGTGVTVNTVLGGPIYSDGVATVVRSLAAAQSMPVEDLKAALVRPTSLVQRFLEPEEVANLVAFLASPLASATNGAAIRADGGVLPTLL